MDKVDSYSYAEKLAHLVETFELSDINPVLTAIFVLAGNDLSGGGGKILAYYLQYVLTIGM